MCQKHHLLSVHKTDKEAESRVQVMNKTLRIREVLIEPLFQSALKHPSANLVSFLVFSCMPTAMHTLYRHEIGYLELQIGNGGFKVHPAQLH